MKRISTVIIGAGQAGLAMSKQLADRSVDHVLLERGEVANSWRRERWDSLLLLTPNWQSRLPGYAYLGNQPDAFMNMPEVIRFLQGFADFIDAPVELGTTVTSVSPVEDGYVVKTDRGAWSCPTVVVASGACNIPAIPKIAEGLPSTINSITPMDYRNPDQLDPGGVMVVGASATGTQLALEIQQSGRQVILSAGEHVRVPRVYRGKDIKWWMDLTGVLDMDYREVDDIRRARNVPSLQLTGSTDRSTLDLNVLTNNGVEIVGRIAGIRDGVAMFSGALANLCAMADLKMNRLLNTIDEWVTEQGLDGDFEPPHRFEPTRVDADPPLTMDLNDGPIRTILWATGYRPDYSWLDVPVLDRKGYIRHDGGVTEAPGMYLMGMPFLRKRKSSLIDGAGDDSEFLAEHLHANLGQKAA